MWVIIFLRKILRYFLFYFLVLMFENLNWVQRITFCCQMASRWIMFVVKEHSTGTIFYDWKMRRIVVFFSFHFWKEKEWQQKKNNFIVNKLQPYFFSLLKWGKRKEFPFFFFCFFFVNHWNQNFKKIMN